MRLAGKLVVRPIPVIRVRCITDKYSNFTYNKIYEAEARGKTATLYTDFKVIDEDGDLYTIHESALGRLFLIIPEVNIKKH